jgi:hypothetical protein
VSPPSQPSRINTRRVARVMCALAGGIHASQQDKRDAEAIEAAFPGTMDTIRGVRSLHAYAATWAVAEQGVRGVVVAAAGFPSIPDPFAQAFAPPLSAAPDVRVVLADPDDEATLINRAVLGRDPRVTAVRARALDPEGVLCNPAALALPGPLLVLLPFVASLWTGEEAARALAGYRRHLQSGSLLCMTLWVPDGGPEGERSLAQWRQRVGPVYGHRAQDVAHWLASAGFRGVAPGTEVPRVEDVRILAEGERWRERGYRLTRPGRMVKAVARVP